MGFLNRVKGRVKGGIKKVVGGAKAVHEEAKYPGRPASRNATDSPLWQDDDVSARVAGAAAESPGDPAAVAPAPVPASAADPGGAPTPTDRKDRNDEPFWFMQEGDLDGWDQTNPSEEWRKRHGVEGGNE